MWSFKDHAKTHEVVFGREDPPGFRWLHERYRFAGLAPAERLPLARLLGETSLMFLVHPTITPEQMASYAEVVRTVVKRACR